MSCRIINLGDRVLPGHVWKPNELTCECGEVALDPVVSRTPTPRMTPDQLAAARLEAFSCEVCGAAPGTPCDLDLHGSWD